MPTWNISPVEKTDTGENVNGGKIMYLQIHNILKR